MMHRYGLILLFAALGSQCQTYLITTAAGRIGNQAVGDGGPASSAAVFARAVAADTAGNVYISEGSRVRRVGAGGVIWTIAGDGRFGPYPDGVPALLTSIIADAVAPDTAGNLYLAGGNQIRKISTDGIISTVAARITASHLATDRFGNVYAADAGLRVVHRIAPSGEVTVYAGNGDPRSSGDGGPATAAAIGEPTGVVVDGGGNLYIASGSAHRVRKVNPEGIISTVAGSGLPAFGGDGGPATAASLNSPRGLAVDSAGNLYIADSGNARIRRVAPNGIITTFAGNGARGAGGDGRPAVRAPLEPPLSIAADGLGNLYVAQSPVVRKIGPDGVISKFAGGGNGDRAPAASAWLRPSDARLDAEGGLYIADQQWHEIRRIGADGIIRRIAGDAAAGFAGDGGPAIESILNSPMAVTYDRGGAVYIADTGNHRVRRIDPSGIISTIAGTGAPAFKGDGGPATAAALSSPSGLAVDAAGNLYVADTGNHRVRKVTPGGVIFTVAGGIDPGFRVDGGPGAAALLNTPRKLALDAGGNLYIADNGNSRIRKLTPGGIIDTVADAIAPAAVAVDASGVLYFGHGNRILKKPPEGPPVVIAGGGSSGDGAPATSATIGTPISIDVDHAGNIYFCAEFTNAVRKLEPANIFPLGVANAASLRSDAIAPGEIVTIFWTDMQPGAAVATEPAAGGRFPTVLAGTQVLFDGVAAPVLYRDERQINAIVPYALAGRWETTLQVEQAGKRSNAIVVAVRPASPGIFSTILNQDGTVNSPSNPAERGSAIVLFATGEGQRSPAMADGQVADDPAARPVLPVGVRISGLDAEVLAAGVAPGLAGVMQVQARLPDRISSAGRYGVELRVGGFTAPFVTVSVR